MFICYILLLSVSGGVLKVSQLLDEVVTLWILVVYLLGHLVGCII